jgi:broad specificity phosphatase PhoE
VLILVRHGRTEANAAGLLLGRRLDPGLDELGRQQASALAAAVAGARRVVCSPLLRTRQTAERIGLPVTIDERWVELDYGDLDGVPMAEVDATTWDAWRADADWVPPGGESIIDLAARVRPACEELLEEARTEDVVVVTHVSPIKAAVAWALGADDRIVWRMYCAPASITRIAVAGRTPSLHLYNGTEHLTALTPSS